MSIKFLDSDEPSDIIWKTEFYNHNKCIFIRINDNKKFDIEYNKGDSYHQLITILKGKYPELECDDSLNDLVLFATKRIEKQNIEELILVYENYINYLQLRLENNNISYEEKSFQILYSEYQQLKDYISVDLKILN